MKNIKFIIIGLMTVSALLSCNDEDFLTEKPKTVYTTSTAFEKSSQVDAQLATAYRQAYDLYGGYYMFWTQKTNQQFLHGQGADFFDNVHIGASGDGSGSSYSDFSKWTTNDSKFDNLWLAFYKLISYANLSIYGADQVTWTDTDLKDYIVAQAKFFRGYAYLRLGEMFGGVPIVTQFSETLKTDYVRETRENTYRQAIQDLEDAEAGLPDYPEQDGRVARGVANHFIAEAYLALGIETNNSDGTNYTDAIAAANVTIGLHPLMTSRYGVRANPADASVVNGVPTYQPKGNVFYDMFQIGNYDYSEGNTEAVWVMQSATYDQVQSGQLGGGMFGGGFPNLPYHMLTAFIGPVFRNINWLPALQEPAASACPFDGNLDTDMYPGGNTCAYLAGFTWGGTSESKYVAYKVWDGVFEDDMRNDSINTRREFLCLDRDHSRYNTVVDTSEIQYPRMMFPVRAKTSMDDWGFHITEVQGTHQNHYGRDWYAVRSAETILLKAEAQLRGGSAADAAITINELRNRANASKTFTGAEVDIYTILDERARELVYEEHRWATLLRMGSSTIGGGSNDVMLNQIYNNAVFVADVHLFTGTIDWTLFPIPLKIIQLNTGAVLEQNPGWD